MTSLRVGDAGEAGAAPAVAASKPMVVRRLVARGADAVLGAGVAIVFGGFATLLIPGRACSGGFGYEFCGLGRALEIIAVGVAGGFVGSSVVEVVMIRRRGQTPGCAMAGISVARIDERPAAWSFVRYVTALLFNAAVAAATWGLFLGATKLFSIHFGDIPGIVAGVALVFSSELSAAASRDGRGIHDRVAGTVVVRTR